MDRIVKPEVVRIPISQGDFIDIKDRLSHGEREDMSASLMPTITPGQALPQVQTKNARTLEVVTWLVRWSLTQDGEPIPMGPELSERDRIATLRSLDPDTFDEIFAAIQEHQRAAAQEKKLNTGALPLVAI